jgi:hypothetical protein
VTAVAIFLGGTVVALWAWTGLGGAASAGDRFAGRKERDHGRHRGRTTTYLRPPDWRKP